MALTVTTWLTACAGMTASGDAGCVGYAEERQHKPDNPEVLPDDWLTWVARVDTRLTAICR